MRKRNFVAGLECSKLLELAQLKNMPLTITTKDNHNNWQVFHAAAVTVEKLTATRRR